MNPVELVNRLRLLVETARTPILVSPERVPPVEPLRPGQTLHGRVGESLGHGTFDVRVAGRDHPVALPDWAKRGMTIRLRVISTDPELVLQHHDIPSGNAGTTANLSASARLAARLREPGMPHRPAAISSPEPLLPSVPASPVELAAALRGAIERSGLFYESHLAQWAEGARELAPLAAEPQARLPHPSRAAPDANLRGRESAPEAAEPQPRQRGPRLPAHDTNLPARDHAANSAATAPGSEPSAADDRLTAAIASRVHPDAIPVLEQQLAALESGQIAWAGTAWPGQRVEWDIAELPHEGRDPHAPEAWQTRLRLRLPNLGPLAATISLSGWSVRIQLGAESDSAARALDAGRAELAAALESAGFDVTSLETPAHVDA